MNTVDSWFLEPTSLEPPDRDNQVELLPPPWFLEVQIFQTHFRFISSGG